MTSEGSTILKELIESSKNLPTSSSKLGTVQLGSYELKRRIQELRQQKPDANFTKAHYLLAGSGVVIEDLEKELKKVDKSSENVGDAIVTTYTNDFDANISKIREENILAAIEQSLEISARDFDNFVYQNISMDWRKRKDEVYASFGLSNKKNKLDNSGFGNSVKDTTDKNSNKDISFLNKWGKPTIGHSVLGIQVGGGEFTDLPADSRLVNVNDYSFRGKFEKYSIIVFQLNNVRQNLKPFPLATCFYDVTKDATDSKTKQINECWKILITLIGESESNLLTEQLFLKQYEQLDLKAGTTLRNRIVQNSTKYLETQFLSQLTNIYHKRQDNEVLEGNGLPTVLNKVKYYLKYLKKRLFGKDEVKKNLLLINDVPIWALIFYLLRVGSYQEVLELIKDEKYEFKKIDSNFEVYFKAFIAGESLNDIRSDFDNNIKNNSEVDPYKYAVYKIVGKCDLFKKVIPKILVFSEDWLWYHFMLIHEPNESTLGSSKDEFYTLKDFQKTILGYGPGHFTPQNYLQVLLLSGLFELAVQYGFTINEIESVHLAIGLVYYGLLKVKKGTTESVTKDTTLFISDGAVSYARLIGYYTRSFRVSDTKVALEYLLLINLANDSSSNVYNQLTREAIRELLIETKEFELLLGSLTNDGSRFPGRIEARQQLLYLNEPANSDSYLDEIIDQSAKRCDDEGRVYESLLLYQLSGSLDKAITITNKLLGGILGNLDISQPISSKYQVAITTAERILKVVQFNPKNLNIKDKDVLQKLLKIVEIKLLFIAGEYKKCLNEIAEIQLLPIIENDDFASVSLKCNQFNQQDLDYNLVKNLGNLLLISMNCINSLVDQNLHQTFYNESNASQVNSLRLVQRNLTVFAAIIKYKLPREVYIKLDRLESVNQNVGRA